MVPQYSNHRFNRMRLISFKQYIIMCKLLSNYPYLVLCNREAHQVEASVAA